MENTTAAPLKNRVFLYVVTESGYFLSHRLPVARMARDAGARVLVATRPGSAADVARIRAEGFRLLPVPFDRSGLNPLRDLRCLLALLRLYRREQPDLIHHVALKPVLYGSLAAWLAGRPAVVNAMAGMGFVFLSGGRLARLLRPMVRRGLALAGRGTHTVTLVQNGDDAALFREMGAPPDRIAIIRGSGVDTTAFRPSPEPPVTPGNPPVALYLGRLLRDKGVEELVTAALRLRRQGVALRVRLAGEVDDNPASVNPAWLRAQAKAGLVELAGRVTDVAGEIARAHMVVLPSYREGLPKALLEGAACGRPLVATDVPGCREICRNGETGLLVPPRDAGALAAALAELAGSAALRRQLGTAARQLAEAAFSEEQVAAETLALYRQLLAARPSRAGP